MTYKLKRQLKKLGNRQFVEDIKKYIKSPYEFYGTKVPELRTLAKRLHEEYTLNDFYRIFNKLWNSGYHGERSLAIYTLQLYKEEFSITTWKFIKPKLKDIKNWDEIDEIGFNIIGDILLKNKGIEKEIFKLNKLNNLWFKRIAIISTIELVKNGDLKLAFRLIEANMSQKEEHIQKAIGLILKEVSLKKPEIFKKFILKNIQMNPITFHLATENMVELRKVRDIKKLKAPSTRKLFFWRLKK